MMSKQEMIVDWLIRQVFPAHKQTITNYIAGNDKLLTADKSKCMSWKGEPSDYVLKDDKYLSYWFV